MNPLPQHRHSVSPKSLAAFVRLVVVLVAVLGLAGHPSTTIDIASMSVVGVGSASSGPRATRDAAWQAGAPAVLAITAAGEPEPERDDDDDHRRDVGPQRFTVAGTWNAQPDGLARRSVITSRWRDHFESTTCARGPPVV